MTHALVHLRGFLLHRHPRHDPLSQQTATSKSNTIMHYNGDVSTPRLLWSTSWSDHRRTSSGRRTLTTFGVLWPEVEYQLVFPPGSAIATIA